MARLVLIYILLFINLSQIKADNDKLASMRDAMQGDDYIRVSLLVASAGNEVYSAAGHSALRMECPSKEIDYCYEYNTDVNIGNIVAFICKNIQGMMCRHYTNDYITRYRNEGRGVSAIQLNLNPEQKVLLWQNLDIVVDSEETGRFDFMDNNCVGTIRQAVDDCLGEEYIVYDSIKPQMTGTFRDTFSLAFNNSPWIGLFWNLLLGVEYDKPSSNGSILWPIALLDVWSKSLIKNPEGKYRPMIKGKIKTLLSPTVNKSPSAISPAIVFFALFIISIFVTLCEQKGLSVVGHLYDILLMSTETIIGLIVITSWNWLIIVFSPIPLLLWIFFHKRFVMKYLYLSFTLILLTYCILTPIIPQMKYGSIQILLIAFAVRTYSNWRFYPKNIYSLKA